MSEHTSKKDYRSFGLIVGSIVSGVFGFLIPYLKRNEINELLLGIGGVLIVLGLFIPVVLKYPYIAWMKIGEVLGWINTRIILGVIFYLLITPIGLIKKIFGTDSMRRDLDRNAHTYRVQSDIYEPSHMKNPF